MSEKTATCGCGQLQAIVSGEPSAVSACHCLDCQKRTGSAFGLQARYPSENVEISGTAKSFSRTGESGASVTFGFCSQCGTTLYWNPEKLPGQTSVAVGCFADPNFCEELSYTVYDVRKHPWVGELGAKEHYD